MLDFGSADGIAALDADALRENHLEGFVRKWVMPEDGEGARGDPGAGSCGLSDARGGMASRNRPRYFTTFHYGITSLTFSSILP